jgi:hypothetical protein
MCIYILAYIYIYTYTNRTVLFAVSHRGQNTQRYHDADFVLLPICTVPIVCKCCLFGRDSNSHFQLLLNFLIWVLFLLYSFSYIYTQVYNAMLIKKRPYFGWRTSTFFFTSSEHVRKVLFINQSNKLISNKSNSVYSHNFQNIAHIRVRVFLVSFTHTHCYLARKVLI